MKLLVSEELDKRKIQKLLFKWAERAKINTNKLNVEVNSTNQQLSQARTHLKENRIVFSKGQDENDFVFEWLHQLKHLDQFNQSRALSHKEANDFAFHVMFLHSKVAKSRETHLELLHIKSRSYQKNRSLSQKGICKKDHSSVKVVFGKGEIACFNSGLVYPAAAGYICDLCEIFSMTKRNQKKSDQNGGKNETEL